MCGPTPQEREALYKEHPDETNPTTLSALVAEAIKAKYDHCENCATASTIVVEVEMVCLKRLYCKALEAADHTLPRIGSMVHCYIRDNAQGFGVMDSKRQTEMVNGWLLRDVREHEKPSLALVILAPA